MEKIGKYQIIAMTILFMIGDTLCMNWGLKLNKMRGWSCWLR